MGLMTGRHSDELGTAVLARDGRLRGGAGRAQRARARQGHQLGASALEWAIISAILVAAALAIGLVVRRVIDKRTGEIENG